MGSRLGELDPESAAFAKGRLKTDLSAHAVDRPFHNREPDAGAFVLFVAVNAGENPKDPLLILWGDADAVILDVQSNRGRLHSIE